MSRTGIAAILTLALGAPAFLPGPVWAAADSTVVSPDTTAVRPRPARLRASVPT